MTTSTQDELARRAAERYASVLVPAILGPAARALVDSSDLDTGDVVVDVGCGSGAATFAAAERVGRAGLVIGVDVNPAMLAIARSTPRRDSVAIEWHEASAYALPVADESADAVLCAQVLQFLDDRPRGVAEMHRVLKPRGRLFASAWCSVESNPYFGALVESVRVQLGEETAAGLHAAFSLSSLHALRGLLEHAGFTRIEVAARRLELDLPAPAEFVPRHLGATPLADTFASAPPAIRFGIVRHVTEALASYVHGTGLRVPFTTHLASAVA